MVLLQKMRETQNCWVKLSVQAAAFNIWVVLQKIWETLFVESKL
ncbi:hypothetical protein AVDCRST_MAG94-6689 [uncultured Leptolyngbya sp.]|uniref:Uncharacterized protein n=1 Tax=uncultured Leptolyngbya sp. TaxID=332963 RepID=A0A6J4PKT8_9CYAN|nr:hypothetical protein AVDCRST_MAG94-6689 [uncultured Leptolyngbya sp.]